MSNEDNDTTDSKTPRNLQRASTLRTKAAKFGTDFTQLGRWEKNDTPDGPVAQLRAELEAVIAGLNKCADMYEALPAEVMRSRRGIKSTLEPGMIAQVKEKYADTYLAVTDGEPVDHLKVVTRRDTHVLVETPQGVRLFVPAKELEPREDA